MDDMTEFYNKIYQEKGYHGVIRTVEGQLHLGRVTKKADGLYCITTGGWSEDEEIINSLRDIFSKFGQFHYVGNIRGGAFYFSEHMECTTGAFEIVETLPDRETCNPEICKYCKYSNNGKRDPARSITMCDGCRYNEEFKHR
ncbi:MAG: hypothetical protein BZ138_07970 [Methanosphaera sp. rholeuAM270]|nr:MAG: hypothetical protein BZ138_07970 [Methanosphaera sp. rholeuAM270]